MCGIAGILNLAQARPLTPGDLLPMIAALHHRGPDEAGLYIDDAAALGQARLSIIDLASGTQPLSNEDGTLWIAYNGELFNYLELRENLLRGGHRFSTSSDTEVIVHLYEEYGPECLHRMNGQFALAIWNRVTHELFLARDRFGILPLHYSFHRGRLLFASEIKALFASPLGPEAALDARAIGQVFTFWSTVGERTSFQNVHQLEPGHYALVRNGKFHRRCYWTPPLPHSRQHMEDSFNAAQERIRELLIDSTRIRMRADVPVGSYLSGGLDSSIIAMLARTRFSERLKTFGIRFDEARYDEGEFQEEMVRALGVEHGAVQATQDSIGVSIPQVVWHCETPVLRTSPAPMFLLSKLVNDNGIKVVLSGEGSDEIFAGYNMFKEAKIRAWWARQKDSTLRPMLLKKLYPYVFRDARLYPFLKNFYARGLDAPNDPLFSHLVRWENTRRLSQFFADDFAREAFIESEYADLMARLPAQFSEYDTISRAQHLEISLFLSNYLLCSQADRVAMAHSIELRVPYLDHRLIEYLARVPSQWKLRVLNEKYLLKSAFARDLPPTIGARGKHPYRAPIQKSLLSKSNRQQTLDMLSAETIGRWGLFQANKVHSLLDKLNRQDQASEMDEMALAGILTTQHLCESFLSHRRHYAVPDLALCIDQRTKKENVTTSELQSTRGK